MNLDNDKSILKIWFLICKKETILNGRKILQSLNLSQMIVQIYINDVWIKIGPEWDFKMNRFLKYCWTSILYYLNCINLWVEMMEDYIH